MYIVEVFVCCIVSFVEIQREFCTLVVFCTLDFTYIKVVLRRDLFVVSMGKGLQQPITHSWPCEYGMKIRLNTCEPKRWVLDESSSPVCHYKTVCYYYYQVSIPVTLQHSLINNYFSHFELRAPVKVYLCLPVAPPSWRRSLVVLSVT